LHGLLPLTVRSWLSLIRTARPITAPFRGLLELSMCARLSLACAARSPSALLHGVPTLTV
jgi:hypothetical protein